MYILKNDQYFCCEPGQYGVLPSRGYAGICVPNDQVVASSLVATAASQVGGGALTTGVNTNLVATSATKTVTSTLKDGGITTITTEVKSTATATATGSSDGELGSGSSSSESAGSSGSSTSKKSKSKLSTGATVGIAIGAVAVALLLGLLLWKVLGARKAKNNAAATASPDGHAAGGAPAYTPQPQQQTPVMEYKTPVAVQQGQVGTGGEWGGSPSPPLAHGQAGYMPPALTQQPVEAPSKWERRVEM